MDRFFNFYKNTRFIFKVLLFWLFLLFCLLWCIGSLAKWDRCVMFIVGLIAAFVLTMVFHDALVEWFNSSTFREIIEIFSK